MFSRQRLFVLLAELIVLAFAFAQMALAQTALYVATNGTGDGSTWANATNSIQGAIDAIDGTNPTNTVWVSNGVYEVGGVTNWPSGALLTNRVAIYKAITVRSANNDPTNTIIKGAWGVAGTPYTNGPAAVRCVYMADGSSLIGFTLTNGATLETAVDGERNGGGVYCQSTNTVISNCVIVANTAYNYGGGASYGTLYNCTVSTNKALADPVGGRGRGGGTSFSALYNCTVINNRAGGVTYSYGGGAYNGTLSNCTLIGNSGAWHGGGAAHSTLFNCMIVSNSADYGGGVCGGTLSNCTLIGNGGVNVAGGGAHSATLYNCTLSNNWTSSTYGRCGGAHDSILYNCILTGNSAGNYGGGGAYNSTLYNCTIANNSASGSGGGARGGALINCIVYFNSASSGSNWYHVEAFTNTCTAPAATNGVGNITDNPMFVDTNTANYRLSANSPCINAGLNQDWMTNSFDLDSRTRIRYVTVDMGAFERIYEGTIFKGR